MIKGITVENVKGIVHQDIKLNALPNTVTYVVAPNGTGKSSLATAFNRLGKNGIRLNDSEFRDGKRSNFPSLSIALVDGETLWADSAHNNLYGKIGVSVINSGLFAKQSIKQFGGHSTARADIAVPEVQLAKKKPMRVEAGYSIRDIRKAFPAAVSGHLTNYKEDFSTASFVSALAGCQECFRPTTGSMYARMVDALLDDAASTEWSVWSSSAPDGFEKVKPLKAMVGKLPFLSRRGASKGTYLDALQLNRFCCDHKKDVYATAKWLDYKELKASADELVSAIDTTGAGIRTHERKGVLLVDFPVASRMSNGERDVMQFAMQLVRVGSELSRCDMAMLIVDEVLDYLDDANLMVAHYYIGKMLDSFKRAGKELYVLLLTHLDPRSLSSRRMPCKHVAYFGREGEGEKGKISGPMRKLLVDRATCQRDRREIYEEVSSLYLHFCNSLTYPSADTVAYVVSKGFDDEAASVEGFRADSLKSLFSYLREGEYDAARVCCALRVMIEGWAYDSLPQEHKAGFLEVQRGTESRLAYAEERGVTVPDIFHMLGELYNDCMHLSGESSQEVLTYRKLENKVICSMIAEAATLCGVLNEGDSTARCGDGPSEDDYVSEGKAIVEGLLKENGGLHLSSTMRGVDDEG